MRRLRVDLDELASAFENSSYEMHFYLDLETGKVELVTEEDRFEAEGFDEEDDDDELSSDQPPVASDPALPEWRQEALAIARGAKQSSARATSPSRRLRVVTPIGTWNASSPRSAALTCRSGSTSRNQRPRRLSLLQGRADGPPRGTRALVRLSGWARAAARARLAGSGGDRADRLASCVLTRAMSLDRQAYDRVEGCKHPVGER